MTFAIRTVARRASGSEIDRPPKVIDANEVTVGRGADCEIRLADLAVSLRHALLRQAGPGRVVAAALGDQPFEVDGQFTALAELDLTRKPKLVFGSHVLTLYPSEDGADVRIDVARMDIGSESAAAEPEDRVFNLASATFGKRPLAWSLGLVILAAALGLPLAALFTHNNARIHADRQWSSGPLSQSHAFLSHNCVACHQQAFVAVRDDACLACHRASSDPAAVGRVAAKVLAWGGPAAPTLIADHAAHDRLLRSAPPPPGLGGKVRALFRQAFNHPNDRCASCHLEHLADSKGAAAAANHVAGSARTTPALVMVNSCTDCHGKLRERLGTTALVDTPDWRHHPDFKAQITHAPVGSRMAVERISLVQRPSEYTGVTFSHQAHLLADGGVTRMALGLGLATGPLGCADCHRPDKSGKGFQPVEMVRDCSSCHSLSIGRSGGVDQTLAHGHPELVAAKLRSFYASTTGSGPAPLLSPRWRPGLPEGMGRYAQEAAPKVDASEQVAKQVRAIFAPNGMCGECHTVLAPSNPASLDYGIAPVHLTHRYLPWGDFDHSVPAHRRDAKGDPTCADCHRAAASDSASDVLLPRVSECAQCHGRTKARTATAASADCAECHSYHAPGAATPKSRTTVVASADGTFPALASLAGGSQPATGN